MFDLKIRVVIAESQAEIISLGRELPEIMIASAVLGRAQDGDQRKAKNDQDL